MGTAFETEMGVLPELSKAVQEMDWILPTDIQSEAVPLILGGGDVLMAAETGSGKTGAFCLPVIQIVYETLKDLEGGKLTKKTPEGGIKVAKNVCLNVFDRTEAFAIDPNGLLCQSRDQFGWHGARATKGVRNHGKYYYEAKVTDDGLCRVGWSTALACHDIGTDTESFGFGGTGKKSHRRQFDDYGESFGLNDVLGCYLDLDSRTISWSKNGRRFPKAFDVPPHHVSAGLFPSVSLKNAELLFNFGETPFAFPPTGGFISINTAEEKNVVLSSYTGGKSQGSFKPNAKSPLALIVEPSRELAEQTYDQMIKFKKYLKDPSPRVTLIIGGTSARELTEEINKGVDIVVATPGRLEDMISTGALFLSNCRFFILDECDGLLSAGYEPMIQRLHALCPKVTPDGKRLQMVVCSATLHSFDVKKIANRLMHFPVWIDLKGQDSVPETVHHVVCPVDPHQDTSWRQLMSSSTHHIQTDGVHMKDRLNPNYETPELMSEAVKLLKGQYVVRAIEQQKMDRALIFCRTKLDCDNLEQYFITLGGGPSKSHGQFSCVCLHSDRNPAERKTNLQKFKNGDVNFLICTDVAARGIDITGLPYVINVTLPDEKQNYIHRIGRVGRAERMGLAISLVSTCKEKVWYHANCNSRGRGCFDTRLVSSGGCCIWYDEKQLLGEIEEHLGITIDTVSKDLQVPANEFDGKVVYGQKLKNIAPSYKGHTAVLKEALKELNVMEKRAQISFLNLRYGGAAKC
ncbi:ATP-dependent RNA helicase DDX1 [Echinococcus granulosus]|uniref:ATP-dependent RNA helicase n=1 Tax=Echinococcus granulosus TaxID=6210 RepID=A0A068WTU5_ECHGR|nr:ATP-dependent RNA helicase DDX1 [Echinococcus granulosus]CDS21050.1 ATP dependent RNA helicase Ddx1 [Echinococcus granulosus]